MTSDSPLSTLDEVRHEPICRLLRKAAAPATCHLVGGYLRDRLLGLRSRDVDAVVGGGAGDEVARRLSERLPARRVDLGRGGFASYRLVTSETVIDLWDRQQMTVRQDLMRRDFTVNSIALDLTDGGLEDPADGLGDLRRRILRATTGDSFTGDPLRVLRLPRMAALLPDFAIEPETVERALAAVPQLSAVAGERIREELRLLFSMSGFRRGYALLTELRPFPEIGTAAGDRAPAETDRDLELIERLAAEVDRRRQSLRDSGSCAVDPSTARWSVVTSGSGDALRDPAPDIRALHASGLLTRKQRDRLLGLADCAEPPRGRLQERRFLHRHGRDWATAWVVAAVRERSKDGPETLSSLLDLARDHGATLFDPPRLVDGTEVSGILGLQPGPEVGEILDRLERLQVEGRLRSRADAVEWLESRREPAADL